MLKQRATIWCVLILFTSIVIAAQQGTEGRFEVASIKANKSGATAAGGTCTGADQVTNSRAMTMAALGRCHLYNVSVEYLINMAYWAEVVAGDRLASSPGLGLRIIGLPSWCKSERFDVEAKAEDATATQAQLRVMLRYLLSERFAFQFHRMSQEVPGFRLVADKDGRKLSRSSPDEPFRFRGSPGEAISQNSPLSNLQDFLSFRLDAPVVNATGLSGNFDFTLTFTPINGTPTSDPPQGPSVFTALQEQLGLKLEKTRLSVVIYVVDTIERPTVN